MERPQFRLFVSSTFVDFAQERNALRDFVFPKIEAFSHSLGADFVPIDLRWGLTNEASLAHNTTEICLKEIARSQRITPYPNVLIMLGQRYGWRPLPTRIATPSLQELEGVANHQERELLRKWYLLDENTEPNQYALQPRTGEFRLNEHWTTEVEVPLVALFDAAEVPLLSVTELEIRHALGGPLASLVEPSEFAICVERHVETGQAEVMTAARSRELGQLASLKSYVQDRIGAKVPGFVANHRDGEADEAYLGQLSNHIEAQLRQRISESIGARGERGDSGDAAGGRWRGSIELPKFKDQAYLNEVVERSRGQICWLIGDEGSGKTVLLTQIHQLLAGAGHHRHVIALDCSLPTAPCSVGELEEFVLRQARKLDNTVESTGSLRIVMEKLAADGGLLLTIDGAEHVEEFLPLMWLPHELPIGLSVFIALRPRKEATASLLENLPGVVFEPPKISELQADHLHRSWEAAFSRNLATHQRKGIIAAYAHHRNPKHLAQMFEVSRRWSSFHQPGDLPKDLEQLSALQVEIFAGVERHFPELVTQVLRYLLAARNGFSESEIVDLLSADENFMESFAEKAGEYFALPSDGLPPVLWHRLHHDIEAILSVNKAFGVNLITISSSTSRAAATNLSGFEVEAQSIHKMALNYFKGCVDNDAVDPPPHQYIEYTWHCFQAGDADQLSSLLSDPVFLDAKFKSLISTDKVDVDAAIREILIDFDYLKQMLRQGASLRNSNSIDFVEELASLLARDRRHVSEHPHLFLQVLNGTSPDNDQTKPLREQFYKKSADILSKDGQAWFYPVAGNERRKQAKIRSIARPVPIGGYRGAASFGEGRMMLFDSTNIESVDLSTADLRTVFDLHNTEIASDAAVHIAGVIALSENRILVIPSTGRLCVYWPETGRYRYSSIKFDDVRDTCGSETPDQVVIVTEARVSIISFRNTMGEVVSDYVLPLSADRDAIRFRCVTCAPDLSIVCLAGTIAGKKPECFMIVWKPFGRKPALMRRWSYKLSEQVPIELPIMKSIAKIALDPDDATVACGGENGETAIVRLSDGEVLHYSNDSKTPVTAIRWLDDNIFVVATKTSTWSVPANLVIWRRFESQPIAKLGLTHDVVALEVGSEKNAATGPVFAVGEGISLLAGFDPENIGGFSNDSAGKYLPVSAFSNCGEVIAVAQGVDICLIDVSGDVRLPRISRVHNGEILGLIWSSTGREIFSFGTDNRVVVSSVEGRNTIANIEFTERPSAMSLGRDSGALCIGTAEGQLVSFTVDDGIVPIQQSHHGGEIVDCAVASAGILVGVAGDGFYLLDHHTHSVLWQSEATDEAVGQVGFMNDDLIAVVIGGSKLQVWNWAANEKLRQYSVPEGIRGMYGCGNSGTLVLFVGGPAVKVVKPNENAVIAHLPMIGFASSCYLNWLKSRLTLFDMMGGFESYELKDLLLQEGLGKSIVKDNKSDANLDFIYSDLDRTSTLDAAPQRSYSIRVIEKKLIGS